MTGSEFKVWLDGFCSGKDVEEGLSGKEWKVVLEKSLELNDDIKMTFPTTLVSVPPGFNISPYDNKVTCGIASTETEPMPQAFVTGLSVVPNSSKPIVPLQPFEYSPREPTVTDGRFLTKCDVNL
jgi:hypothetical protein